MSERASKMSYYRITTISGTKTKSKNPHSRKLSEHTNESWKKYEEWEKKNSKCTSMNGHWSHEGVISFAKRHGWRNVVFSYSTADLSGRGRGSTDARFKISATGKIIKLS